MTDSPISVLVVEDDPDNAYLTAHILQQDGSFHFDVVDTLAGARRRLADRDIDVVLLDLNLPDSGGLDTLYGILRIAPDVTVVVHTAMPDEELALQALNIGAEDYLLKGRLDAGTLSRTLHHAYERRRIQNAFSASEGLLDLQRTMSFEQLVATISNRFISMGPSELNRAVHEALERIGAFFDVDRVALYEFSLETGEISEVMFWLAEQNPGLGAWPTQMEIPGFPNLNAYIDREGAFVANRTEDIPEAWEPERRWAELTGSKAGVVVRVELKSSFRGQILLDSMWRPRQWPADIVPRLRMLGEIIAGTIVRQRAEADREQLLRRIQEQARVMQQLIETVPEGVVMLNHEGLILLANPAAQTLLARLAAVSVGDHLAHLGDRSLEELLVELSPGHWHAVSHEGAHHEIIARPVRSAEPSSGYVLVIRDVTHEREIQERAQQQERLAAVGQLAAGVAHDFNNIMSVIMLYASGTQYDETLSPELQQRMEIIQKQAKQASSLTEQILDFGRRSSLERLPLNLNTFFKEAVKLLERTLSENIAVHFEYPDRPLLVNADPTRMQQVITNLVVNARDAMPDGGTLTIRLHALAFARPADAPLANMAPGLWAHIAVGDTGSGIPDEALPHIFEPFFTTKMRGKGTGLGLAQVYGIVKQHGGELDVRTQLGAGTTFHLYLPALPPRREQEARTTLPSVTTGSGETLLLVEDNEAARFALADTLETLNYRVLVAHNGEEGLALYAQHREEIDLVLSDVVMPLMGGPALFYALKEFDPEVRMMLLTGHSMNTDMQLLLADGMAGWLRKPPQVEELARAVAEALKK
jgi:signal transduction histidine kinase/DNA-binding response OmpR family regulator